MDIVERLERLLQRRDPRCPARSRPRALRAARLASRRSQPGTTPRRRGLDAVEGCIDRTRTPHDTLFAWTGLLSKAPSGKVVICQPHTSEVALMGELSAETLQRRGVKGYIVDGGCRDVDFILKIGFPVFSRFFTPADIVARWIPTAFGEPITIGAVHHPQRRLRARRPRRRRHRAARDLAEAAVAKAEAVVQTENRVRTAILEGMDPQEAYLK